MRARVDFSRVPPAGVLFHQTTPRKGLARSLPALTRAQVLSIPSSNPRKAARTLTALWPHSRASGAESGCFETSGRFGARDRIGATWAESQWIVAARPLCHLQYPVAYLSRLQGILPAARWEFLHGVPCDSSAARVSPTTRAFGGRGPYCWSANGRRARASLLARILT